MARFISAWYALLALLAGIPGLDRLVPGRFRLAHIVFSPATGSTDSGVFFDESDAIVSRSQILGQPPIDVEPERFPAVTWSVWSDVEVTNNRLFAYLLNGDQLMIQPRRTPGPWRMTYRRNRLVWSSGTRVLVDRFRGDRLDVDEAVFLGGRDHTNWYHWLIDALPQLHLSQRLPEPVRNWPVLVPEQIFRYPTMVEALELFLANRETIVVPEWAMVHANRLVWIDPLELSNLPQQRGPSSMDPRIHMLHREGMESYRDVYLDAFAPTPRLATRKLFLARDGARRSYNQDAIMDIAQQRGFEPCYPEHLSLAQQVVTFREASHILGPSGAGFAGLLFCQPGTQALCWQDTRIRSMTILPDLAALNHSEYLHVFYTSDESGGLFRSNYELDPTWFADQLDLWLGGR